MHNIYVKDIIDKLNGKLLCGNENIVLDNFSKDTRTLIENDIYIGIKGESFDGNTLYKEAFLKGAKGCILDTKDIDMEYINSLNDKFVIQVDDTIKCLQKLAKLKRNLYDIPVVAITGSVGKTSTKDIISSVLSQKYNVLKTEGNYNNHIGLPLTILKLKNEDCLVVEMGMNNLGEISVLSKIAEPTLAVITNVGTAHIGNLGSRENILKAKLEICDGLKDNGVLIINNDNDLLHKYYLNNKNNIITFGINEESDFKGLNVVNNIDFSNYDIVLDNKKYDIKVNIPGNHFVLNSLCAIAVGNYFNINIDKIKIGIEKFELTKKRMEIENINNVTIIGDYYNANYDSMKSAIEYLGSLNKRKIAIVGDMLELGDYSEKLHRDVGKCLYDKKIDIVITIGENSQFIKDELLKLGFNKNNIYSYNDNKKAIKKIKEIISDDAVLIKASNGMHLGEIYEELIKYLK